MESKDLNDALEVLKKDIIGANETQVKDAIEAFETKNKEAIDVLQKAQKEAFDLEIKGINENLEAVQKHADKLDVKMQGNATKKANKVDAIKNAITENFEDIRKVKKGVSIDTKVVGDMTTANLSGDEPRDYNFDVVKIPGQKVNVSDLVGSVNISGGTYTYTRELAGEGSIGAQTEGSSKLQRDYDFLNVDVATDFIAGFARYSKKMKNNLPYLESFIPMALRRDYFKAENAAFQAVLAADATASTEIITGSSKAEMLVNEAAKQEDADFEVTAHVVRPSDWYDILKTPKDNLFAIVTFESGVLRINGIPCVKATWLPANKYFSGDWSRVNKINTEGLSLAFSDTEGSNFVTNNITARIESQTALAVEQPAALIYGDFTAV
jgi:HK97 family phage major capsid protein